MDTHEKILSFIRLKGPSIPVQISKEIGTNILLASAYLSELTSRKQLKASSVKIGGSPLYFLPGQESHLQLFSEYLNEKDRRTYELLKEKKILRENQQESLIRVSLRSIKDFAVPLQVNYSGTSEIFWKWYLLPTKEAETMIKFILEPQAEPVTPLHSVLQEHAEDGKKEEKIEAIAPKRQILPVKEAEAVAKKEKKLPEEKKAQKKKKAAKEDFLELVVDYFSKNKIEVLEQNTYRKGDETDGLIRVPSAVGELTYYYKAKNKQRINEGDLSAAFIMAQEKNLPTLFLTNGQLTKKASEMLGKQFRNMQVRQLKDGRSDN